MNVHLYSQALEQQAEDAILTLRPEINERSRKLVAEREARELAEDMVSGQAPVKAVPLSFPSQYAAVVAGKGGRLQGRHVTFSAVAGTSEISQASGGLMGSQPRSGKAPTSNLNCSPHSRRGAGSVASSASPTRTPGGTTSSTIRGGYALSPNAVIAAAARRTTWESSIAAVPPAPHPEVLQVLTYINPYLVFENIQQ